MPAHHRVIRIESRAVAVLVVGRARLGAEPRRERHGPAETPFELTVSRKVGRVIGARERRTQRIACELVALQAVFLELERVESAHPAEAGVARGRIAQESQVLAQRAAPPFEARVVVVGRELAPVRIVAPVTVEAVVDVGLGDCARGHEPSRADIAAYDQRAAGGSLRIPTWPVGVRRERIVGRENVVAVVEIRVHGGCIDTPRLGQIESDLAADRGLAALVGVVAVEERVVAEAVRIEALRDETPGGFTAARTERPAGLRTCAPKPVLACHRLCRERRRGLRIARVELDQAGERIRAVARALRPAQNLDLLDIEQRRRHADAAEIDVVDQESDRRVGRALVLLELADPAQLEVART